jgi:UDP-GlcNAc:undecaprenyl-phosphate GlcNAc-1-phosphate transferase
MKPAILAMATAFVAALVLTPVARRLSVRLGMVAQPRPDRWAAKPTAKLGGAAIFLAVVLGLLAGGVADRRTWIVMAACTLMFAIGLIDDFFPLRPHHKLVLQTIPSILVILQGLVLPWTSYQLLNIGFTVLWLVGITNAINLLDNMDGLATGIAAIASVSLAVNFLRNNQLAEAAVIGTLFAALIAFLIYNFHPASIFMGDCGSLFIGFTVASVALLSLNVGGRSRTLLPVIFVPVLILLIPIFDTAFVAFVRKLAGRPSMMGGRDHTSHRLVALGLHERTAVLLLYALALVAGGVAIAARDLPFDISIALSGAVAVLLAILGFYLAGVKVYAADDTDRTKPALTSFLIDLSYRRRVFEVLLDLILITASYYLAYRLHFGPPDGGPDWKRFIETLPIILAVKLAMFLFSGIYGGIWRYMSVEDGLVFGKAVAGSSIAAVLVLLGISRFEGLSRVAFILDALILFVLVAATRSSFRILETLTKRVRSAGPGARTLIYGAGDAGELLLRELGGNRSLELSPVAFFDDDPRKAGRAMRSMPVLGGDFEQACVGQAIGVVVLSTSKLPAQRLQEITAVCRRLDLPLRQLTIAIVPVRPFAPPAPAAEAPSGDREIFGAAAPES